MQNLPYRPCVGIMLVNHRDLVMIGRRVAEAGPEHVDDTHAWQMPQGGIDPGEDPLAAAIRNKLGDIEAVLREHGAPLA